MISTSLLVPLSGLLLCLSQTDESAGLVEKEEAAFKAVAAAAGPSVVRIETLGGVDTVGGRLLGSGPATGTIVREDGLILTSSEAFAGNPTSILVRLPDGRRVAAVRAGEDKARRLTAIKIEPPEDGDPLVPAVPAKIDDLKVGDWAIAVGRTFSVERVNLSVGVVSAKDRILGRAVQTDAKISPANYGGPLVDLTGRTIGILAPLSADGGAGGVEWYDSGIGFAVPLADLTPVFDRLAAGETLKPGRLGVTFKGSSLDAEPIVDSVRPNSPADKAGVRTGDRLVTVAGLEVSRPDSAKLALGPLYAGDDAELVVERDGQQLNLTATLVAQLPAWSPSHLGVLPDDPEETEEADADNAVAGVRIAHVFPDTPADGALSEGDVVTSAGGETVTTADDLRRIVSRRLPGAELTLERATGDAVTVTVVEPPTAPPADLPDTVDLDADPLPEDDRGRIKFETPGFEGRGGSLFVPPRPGRGGYALLVCPPPKDSPDFGALFNRLRGAAERHGVILMVPKSDSPRGFQPADLPFVAAAVEQMRERYAVDPTRTALFGTKMEGRTVWRIAAAAKMTYRGVASTAIPLGMGQNEPDAGFHLLVLGDPPEAAAKMVRKAGYPLAVLEEGLSGDDASVEDLTDESADAIMRWVTTLDRI